MALGKNAPDTLAQELVKYGVHHRRVEPAAPECRHHTNAKNPGFIFEKAAVVRRESHSRSPLHPREGGVATAHRPDHDALAPGERTPPGVEVSVVVLCLELGPEFFKLLE